MSIKPAEIIEHVIRADSSSAGRKSARLAVKKLCAHIGVSGDRTAAGIRIIFSEESGRDFRPRVSLGFARKLLGISNTTFWRWRRENKFGAGEIEIIPVHKTANDTYLDQVLEVMKKSGRGK